MTETKQLDAHDALLLMAEAFDGADENGKAFVCRRRTYYLCYAVAALFTAKRISQKTADELRRIIDHAVVGKSSGKLFPVNREGARQRAAWCRAEAAKLRPAVRTVADVLREMPVDTVFTRPIYRTTTPWTKTDDDVFTDGDTTMTGRRFEFLDRPHDDPIYGIVILSAPDAVPPTSVRCWAEGYNRGFHAKASDKGGIFLEGRSKRNEGSEYRLKDMSRYGCIEITPAAALDLLKDWPEGRERFLTYCREHPPVEEPKPEQPAGVVVTRPRPLNPYEVTMPQDRDSIDPAAVDAAIAWIQKMSRLGAESVRIPEAKLLADACEYYRAELAAANAALDRIGEEQTQETEELRRAYEKQLAAVEKERNSARSLMIQVKVESTKRRDELAAATERAERMREALVGAKSFIENLKVPQTVSEAAEQVRQGMHRMNCIEAALNQEGNADG